MVFCLLKLHHLRSSGWIWTNVCEQHFRCRIPVLSALCMGRCLSSRGQREGMGVPCSLPFSLSPSLPLGLRGLFPVGVCAAHGCPWPLCLPVLSLLLLNLGLTDTAEAGQPPEHGAVPSASVSPSVKCRDLIYPPWGGHIDEACWLISCYEDISRGF